MRRVQLRRALSVTKYFTRRSNSKVAAPASPPEQLEPRLLLSSDAIVSGMVFNDLNGDGIRDANEAGMSGVLIYADLNGNDAHDTATEPSVLSGSDGSYELTGLPRQVVTIQQVVPANHEQSLPAASPRLYSGSFAGNQIAELDAMTGELIRSFAPPVAITSAQYGLAAEGGSLFSMQASTRMLHEFSATTGQLLNSYAVPVDSVAGLAIIDHVAYIFNALSDVVTAFDLQTQQVVRELDLRAASGGKDVSGGLGELVDSGQLVVATSTSEVLIFDALTGAITSSFSHSRTNVDLGVAAIGNEVYLGFALSTGPVQVYNAQGEFQREFFLNRPISALAGVQRTGWQADLTFSDAPGLDFGNNSTVVTGVVFDDANGNGVRGEDEDGMAGVLVYADLNNNSRHDSGGEPFTFSAGDGSYELAGLPATAVTIRQVIPDSYVQTTPVEVTGLYGTDLATDKILELDPATGSVLRRIPSPVPLDSQQQGLAFDGTSLYLMQSNDRVLYRIDPDSGQILDSFAVPVNVAGGLAVIDQMVYVFDPGADTISAFDLQTRTLVNTLAVGQITGRNLSGGLGEIAAMGQLVVATTTNEVLTIDAETGQAVATFTHNLPNPEVGITTVGNEIILSFLSGTGGRLQVYDFEGQLQREVSGTGLPVMFGLGGNSLGAWQVDLSQGGASGIDFGNATGLVTGAVFSDLDGDGMRDDDESGLAGVLVYTDLNNDRMHNPGHEPFAVTDADGLYGFSKVPAAAAIIRQVIPDGYQQTSPDQAPARLFTTNTATRQILELDVATGEVLSSFPVPAATLSSLHSLSFDDSSLYFGQFGDNTVYRLNPDSGAVLETIAAPTFGMRGLAVMGDLLFAAEPRSVRVLDRGTGLVTNFPTTETITALDVITDARQLVATTTSGKVLVFDIDLRRPVYSFQLAASGTGPTAVAATETEIYVGFAPSSASGPVHVYNHQGELLRQVAHSFPVRSLAGDSFGPSHRADLSSGGAGDVTFGLQQLGGTLRGVKFEDIDGDGQQDADEPALHEVGLYLDLNHNGILDVTDSLTLDPDAFFNGQIISKASDDVTLWRVSPNQQNPSQVIALQSSVAGNHVFSHTGFDGPHWTNFSQLKIEPHHPTLSVTIDVTSASGFGRGTLQAFDAQGNLLSEYVTPYMAAGETRTMTLSDPRAAYFTAGGDFFTTAILDNLNLGFSEPTAVSDAAGHYAFENLAPGKYEIRDIVPEGFLTTQQPDQPPPSSRLFTANVQTDMIVELDPATGSAIRSFAAPRAIASQGVGLAYDGQSLYFVHVNDGVLYELNAETGAVVRTATLSLSDGDDFTGRQFTGIAAMNDMLYLLDNVDDDITVIDPVTLAEVGEFSVNSSFNLATGLGEVPGLDRLVALSTTDDVVLIDPTTGLVDSSFKHNLGTISDFAVAGVGDEILIGYGNGRLQTYSSTGQLRGEVSVGFTIPGLGAAGTPGGFVIERGQVIDSLDFGYQRLRPVIRTLSIDPVVDEGGIATLVGTFIDPRPDRTHTVLVSWGDGPSDVVTLPVGDRSFAIPHRYLDDAPTGTPIDRRTVTVRILDEPVDPDPARQTLQLMVRNVVPTIETAASTALSIGNAGTGEVVTFTATFTDPGWLDTHVAVIDWGDGATSAGTISFANGIGTVTAQHAYSTGGIFDVTATLSDDDQGTTAAQTLAIITGVGIHNGSLQVVGTAGYDDVQIDLTDDPLPQILVAAGFLTSDHLFDPAAANRIELHLGEGDDIATVGPKVLLDTFIFGGAGNDSLKGGGGSNVLVGSDGDDTLIGGANRDILIGGMGADVAIAKGEQDVLIGGKFAAENDTTTLAQLLAEWRREDLNYDQRLTSLKSLGLGGSNVQDDGIADVLRGLLALDWFLLGDGDKTDEHEGEEATIL